MVSDESFAETLLKERRHLLEAITRIEKVLRELSKRGNLIIDLNNDTVMKGENNDRKPQ